METHFYSAKLDTRAFLPRKCLLLLLRREKYDLNFGGIGSFFGIRPVMGSYSQAKIFLKIQNRNTIICRFEKVELFAFLCELNNKYVP